MKRLILLTFLDKEIICSILDKVSKKRNLKIISFSELYRNLNEQESKLIKSFVKFNPRDFGFKGEFLGMGAVPKDLVFIDGQFLSKPVLSAFWEMHESLYMDTGKRLKIFSGYRSPAYQAIVFLRCLKENKFDFLKTAKGVAFPGYSEHGNPVNHAIDFCPENFEKTEEYKWLIQNANKYGFYLSYPEGNGDGVMFEPWHWRFSG